MADIELSPGTLPPPACYAAEQDRLNAYVEAIIATVTGGLQWQESVVAPTDLPLYWLRKDASGAFGRPIEPLNWSQDDGAWVRWASEVISTGVSGGVANAYTLTNTPAMTAPTAMRPGQIYGMFIVANNTAASTLNIDGVGAFPIRYPNDTTAIVSGDLVTGQGVILMVNQAGNAFLLLSPTASTTTHGSQLIVSSGAGNFTVPGGIFTITVECVGGGGGGGYSGSAKGGGGGGYAYKQWDVTPGTVIPYTVGVAGIAGSNFGAPNSTPGGDTIFNASQIASGGASGDSGGLGGGFVGADWGFNGQSGTEVADNQPDKFNGGKGAYGASYGGFFTNNSTWNPTAGYLGGGGCGDAASPGLESSAGSSGLILIRW